VGGRGWGGGWPEVGVEAGCGEGGGGMTGVGWGVVVGARGGLGGEGWLVVCLRRGGKGRLWGRGVVGECGGEWMSDKTRAEKCVHYRCGGGVGMSMGGGGAGRRGGAVVGRRPRTGGAVLKGEREAEGDRRGGWWRVGGCGWGVVGVGGGGGRGSAGNGFGQRRLFESGAPRGAVGRWRGEGGGGSRRSAGGEEVRGREGRVGGFCGYCTQ